MMKYFKLFIIFISYFYVMNPIISEDIETIINPIISSLMKEKNIPSLQILLFKPGKVIFYQFEYNIQTKQLKIEQNPDKSLYYFAGELSYPLVNFIFNKFPIDKRQITEISSLNKILNNLYELKKQFMLPIKLYNIPNKNYINFYNKNIDDLLLLCLKNMLCGIEISKDGVGITKSQKNITITSLPFQHFYLSTYNYYLLEKIYNKKDIIAFINEQLKTLNINHTFFYKGLINNNLLNQYNIKRGSYSDKKITYIPDIQIFFPLSYGFITNVYDYYKIIQILYKSILFKEYFTLDYLAGGYKDGFYYRYTCDKQFIIAENFGFFPGYRSYSFVMNNGYGFILMQSSDNDYVIHFLRDKIEDIYYNLNNISCNYIYNFDINEFYGYYRPENVVSKEKAIFSDIWIRKNSDGIVEISNFFNKDPIGYLYEFNSLYYFKGYTKLNRYPFIFQQDKNKFISSIYEYKKISWYKSIRGLIILFSFFILIIMIIFIGLILRYYKFKRG
ncbi:MAG: hypothetical protein KatS3mg129_0735 [Leptospiraceae bacterium]|nr:MAG: hypothetical protein KatS3mg129_0735 [Leptospiraceae bacterium]